MIRKNEKIPFFKTCYQMSLITSLYEANDYETDMCVFKTVVPYLQAKNSFNKNGKIKEPLVFEEYDNLPENVRKIFRDLVYEKKIELECTKSEFLQLVNFLKFSLFFKTDFLPLFRRYIYTHLNDMDFLKITAPIHQDRHFVKVKSRLQFGLLLCGMEKIDRDEIMQRHKEGDSNATYVYGVLMDTEKTLNLCQQIHYKNYIENKNSASYHYFINLIYRTNNTTTVRNEVLEMHYKNYVENKNSDSLFDYAHILALGSSEEEIKTAKECHLENWKENKNMASLDEYAFFLNIGLGSKAINSKEGRELLCFNATKNGFASSINTYAGILQSEGDFESSRELYRRNWEENHDFYSLQKLIHFVENGIGGEKDLQCVEALKNYTFH